MVTRAIIKQQSLPFYYDGDNVRFEGFTKEEVDSYRESMRDLIERRVAITQARKPEEEEIEEGEIEVVAVKEGWVKQAKPKLDD